MITFDKFISKYLGKKIDYDNAYAGQCVDLYRQYIKEVLEFPQPVGVKGAADFWTNYDKDVALKDFYEKIPNSPTGVPQKGDVMLWNRNAGGGFGHVSVFIEGDVNGFTSFDQNWPTLSVCTKTKHDYKYVYGWLRPKKQSVIISPPVSNIDYKAIFDKTGDQLPDRALKDDSLFQTDKLYKDNNIPYVTLTADSVNHFMSEFRKFRDIANTPAVTPPDAPQTGDNFEAVTEPPLPVEPDLPTYPATEFEPFDWIWRKIENLARTIWNKIKR